MDKQTLLGIQAALHQRAVIANLIALQVKHTNLIFKYERLTRSRRLDAEERMEDLSDEIEHTCKQVSDLVQNMTLQTAGDQEELVAGQDYEPGTKEGVSDENPQ